MECHIQLCFALASFAPIYEVQKEMFELADDIVEDSSARLAEVQVDFWKKRKAMHTYGGHNYIEQTPMGENFTLVLSTISHISQYPFSLEQPSCLFEQKYLLPFISGKIHLNF